MCVIVGPKYLFCHFLLGGWILEKLELTQTLVKKIVLSRYL